MKKMLLCLAMTAGILAWAAPGAPAGLGAYEADPNDPGDPGGPEPAVIREVIWAENFDSFDPCNPDDPETNPLLDGTWFFDSGPNVLIFDDPCDPDLNLEEFYWDGAPDGGTPIEDPEAFLDSFSPGNYRLSVSRRDTQGTDVTGYARKDITALNNGLAHIMELEFDLLPNFKPASFEGKHIWVEFVSDRGLSFATLLLRSHSSGWYQLNGADIPGAWWRAWQFNRYRMVVNFLTDQVSIYIDDEPEARLKTDLAADFDVADFAGVRFGAGIYFRINRYGYCIVDNISLTQVYLCPPGDVYVDCAVNILDLSLLASQWLESGL